MRLFLSSVGISHVTSLHQCIPYHDHVRDYRSIWQVWLLPYQSLQKDYKKILPPCRLRTKLINNYTQTVLTKPLKRTGLLALALFLDS